jgi:hypothetical protein
VDDCRGGLGKGSSPNRALLGWPLREHEQRPNRRSPQDRRPRSPPIGANQDVARIPITSASIPAARVAVSCASMAATLKVEATRPNARSRTSVCRTDASVMS